MYGLLWGFPGSSAGKESTCNAGDLGSIPGLGKFPGGGHGNPLLDLGSIPGLGKFPGGGHGNPLLYFCPENPHGQSCLGGYSPWGRRESDTTERLSTAQHDQLCLASFT